MKKIIFGTLILTSCLLYGEPLINMPINKNVLSTENGGDLNAIDAYSDGVGFITEGKFKVDNTPMNKLVFEFGEKSKLNGSSLKDFVKNNGDNKETILADELGKIATNIIPKDGTPCDDKNDKTINDVYINGLCKGQPLEYLSKLNKNQKYRYEELKNLSPMTNKVFISGIGYGETYTGKIFDGAYTECHSCGLYFSQHIEANNIKANIIFELKEVGRIWSAPGLQYYDSDINLFKLNNGNWENVSELLISIKNKRVFNYFDINSEWLEPGTYKAERKENVYSSGYPSVYIGLRSDSEWFIEKPYNIN